MRGSLWTFMRFGTMQVLRLASNLMLTRLLMPEAFGVMAIVSAILIGATLFSDTGVQVSVVQSKRGDDPAFLDTAWTIQAIRGALLWGLVALAAHPIAHIYAEPQLGGLLIFSGMSLFIGGLTSTAVYTAERHLHLGRLTFVMLASQVLSLILMGLLAYTMRSVWALAIGSVLASVLTVLGGYLFVPGHRPGFRWDQKAFLEIFHFGKYILLSTAAHFLISNGDRLILGLYIPMSALGIYNIGYFLANSPVKLAEQVEHKVILPLYRLKPIGEGEGNRASIFHTRRLLAVGMVAAICLLAFIGPALVDLLYSPQYARAGAIITLYCLSAVPILTLGSVGVMLLSFGDSRRLLFLQVATAIMQIGLLFAGVKLFGVFGALLAPGIAVLVSYPIRLAFSRRYRCWDPLQDFGITLAGLAICAGACLLHGDAILALIP